ncbi:MAG TPA: hypothetical protein VGE20_09480, partial [Ramlibacter sp.]
MKALLSHQPCRQNKKLVRSVPGRHLLQPDLGRNMASREISTLTLRVTAASALALALGACGGGGAGADARIAAGPAAAAGA